MRSRSYRTAGRVLAGLIAGLALAVPSSAGATTAWVLGSTLNVTDGATDSAITVTAADGKLVVSDAAGDVGVIEICQQTTHRPKKAICPAQDIKLISSSLGSGDDRLDTTAIALPVQAWGGQGDDRVATGAANDVLDGGDGRDVLLAGAGDDRFATRDGAVDTLSCGDGVDSGEVDATDVFEPGCEMAPAGAPAAGGSDPAEPPAGDGSGSAPPTGDVPAGTETAGGRVIAAPVEIRMPATVRLTARGVLPVRVECTAAAGGCRGTIELLVQDGAVGPRAKVGPSRRRKATRTRRRAVRVARRSFALRAGQGKTVPLRLDRAGRRRIMRMRGRKGRRVRGKIVVTTRLPDGSRATSVKHVSIAAPKERRSARRAPGRRRKGASR